jgi:glycosidase
MTGADRQMLTLVTEADLRDRVLTSIDDHDGLGLDVKRRIAGRYGAHTVVPAVALLLFTPGVPCLYYGTEQALTGPVNAAGWLDKYGWNQPADVAGPHGGDRYLREAMFGPEHPRPAGRYGRDNLTATDKNLPGFGPSGTYGQHAFDPGSPWYRAVAAMAKLRKEHRHVLARGSVTRITRGRVDGGRYGAPLPSHVIAWFSQDPAGQSAVVVVDVAPPGTDTAHAIELELPPMRRRPLTWNRRLSIGDDGPDEATVPVSGTPQPQSGICYLAAGPIEPGNVAIFLSNAPASAPTTDEEQQ